MMKFLEWVFPAFLVVVWAVLAWVFLALAGCGVINTRAYTRVEYQEYALMSQSEDALRSQALYLTVGPSFSYSIDERKWLNANLGVSAVLSAVHGGWTDYEPAIAFSPDVMLWLDDKYTQFLHVSVDLAFFEEGQSTVFGFLAWEKIW